MTDGLCLYGDLNEVACDKCAERDRACEKREDGSVGCKRCQYSKLGCSLINRKKKSTRTPKTPKTPKQDSVQELDGEMLVVGVKDRAKESFDKSFFLIGSVGGILIF